MIAFDSCVVIDLLRGQATPAVRALRRLMPTERFVIGDVVLLEVLRGSSSKARAREAEARLGVFDQVAMLTPELALQAATQYRRLCGLGITLGSLGDLIIGAWCLANRVPLLTSDRDFEPLAAHCGLLLQPLDAPSPAPEPG